MIITFIMFDFLCCVDGCLFHSVSVLIFSLCGSNHLKKRLYFLNMYFDFYQRSQRFE